MSEYQGYSTEYLKKELDRLLSLQSEIPETIRLLTSELESRAMLKRPDDGPAIGGLRVWWVPQVPMKAFTFPVKTVDEAMLLLRALAKYDIFQVENRVKPDCANAGGLSVYDRVDDDEEPEWITWYSFDGESIDDLMGSNR